MRKRLRKKKHLKEFKEFGCKLQIEFSPSIDFDAFSDDFICNAIEKNNMKYGGMISSGYVELGNKDIYLKNKEIMEAWLKDHPSVVSSSLSEPEDAWHS